jgi:hypothetical protein
LSVSFSWGILFYGSFIEPKILTVQTTSISLSDKPTTTIRVVVFSDPHLGPYKDSAWMQKVEAKIETLHPDVIFFLGDAIYHQGSEAQAFFPLKQLKTVYGKFAVTGNHDYLHKGIARVLEALKQADFTVLENESVSLDIHGKTLQIVGIDDVWNGGNLTWALSSISTDDLQTPLIVLSHDPDAILYESARKIDLMISGHTHGGQINLPFLGSISSLPTMLGRFYTKGLFSYKGQQLFITPGIGESGPRARLFDPPQISLLVISF